MQEPEYLGIPYANTTAIELRTLQKRGDFFNLGKVTSVTVLQAGVRFLLALILHQLLYNYYITHCH